MKIGLNVSRAAHKETQTIYHAELAKYKAGNVPVTQIIADNEGLAIDIEEMQAEVDKVMNEVYMRRKEAGALRANIRQLQAELKKCRWIPVSERLPDLYGITQSNWVHITNGQSVMRAYYYDYTKQKPKPNMAIGKGWYCHGLCKENITHWKPILLPEEQVLPEDTT